MFSSELTRAGVKYFFSRRAQRQLEDEIRAQFEAFRATGLALDHVNAQCHYHLHPTVLGTILSVARDYGRPPIRIPAEPFFASWSATHRDLGGRLSHALFLTPFLQLMKLRLRAAHVRYNDHVFGYNDTGHMTQERVLEFLAALPPGTTEMYFHAATRRWPGIARDLESYQLEDEFAALVSPRVAEAVRLRAIERIAFRDLADAH
jgi:hopanoid biosynthesis associated protein HpnK